MSVFLRCIYIKFVCRCLEKSRAAGDTLKLGFRSQTAEIDLVSQEAFLWQVIFFSRFVFVCILLCWSEFAYISVGYKNISAIKLTKRLRMNNFLFRRTKSTMGSFCYSRYYFMDSSKISTVEKVILLVKRNINMKRNRFFFQISIWNIKSYKILCF